MRLPQIDASLPLLLSGRPLIDLRAQVEFAAGAFPHAINLPLMSDAERAAVGTCYVQHGQAAAIALGHHLVCGQTRQQRLASWLAQHKAAPDSVLYCLRGGLRSQTVQQWLAEAGVVMPRVRGGYKALRRCLIDEQASFLQQNPLCIVTGMTGSGKTELLGDLPLAVDLEHHARHRGSSFGALPEPQPANVDFENALALDLLRPRHSGWRILEDESRMIGRCTLPLDLFEAMQAAPLVVLECPLAERVQRIRRDYVDAMITRWQASLGCHEQACEQVAGQLRAALSRLEKRLGGLVYRQLQAMMEEGFALQRQQGDSQGHTLWIQRLLVEYYDPVYLRQLERRPNLRLFSGEAAACRHFLQHLG